jgi:putative spermidine/putrescine transport system ATP-binding protein
MGGSVATSKNLAIALRDVCKTFGAVTAVDHVNLDVFDGEFLTLLGPSGSGKTTVLRMIAGFEQMTSGSIFLDDKDVSTVPAFERDVNTVFQDYALFPHMTVRANVEYGLKVKGVSRESRDIRVSEMLDVVQLVGFADRKPNQLSGGQRQRVALARALVNQPKVLLLDEPLGALDLKLREEMQVELKSIQRRLGITFVYVTHDQGEALSMSDRVAVFNRGRIEQIGSPRAIYEQPETLFVAGFVGITNLFSEERALKLVGRHGVFTLRPEHVMVSSTFEGDFKKGTVSSIQYLGAECRVYCAISDSGTVVATMSSDKLADLKPSQEVWIGWKSSDIFEVM